MKLKKLRLENNLTQEEIAKIINKSAVAYGYYESGRNEPDLQTLIRLADLYHTTIDSIVEHEVPYLLDKSTLSNEQSALIEKITNLNKEQCMLVDAYIEGLKLGQQKQEETIKRLKGK